MCGAFEHPVRRAVSWGTFLLVAAGLDEAGFVREDDGLSAVVEVKLGKDACNVRFDRRVADDELAGDVGV